MEYINKFNTTDEYETNKPELSKLEHYVAYDESKEEVHLKPSSGYFIVYANDNVQPSEKIVLYTESGDDGQEIQLQPGANKIENAIYGFHPTRNSSITGFNFSKYNSSNITKMDYMFQECRALTSLDLSSLDTSKVTSMYEMFIYSNALTSVNLSNLDTSKVKDTGKMFFNCYKLRFIDLTNFDTTSLVSFYDMFNIGILPDTPITIRCTQSFKNWCITNQDDLPLTAYINRGLINWDIVN